MIVVHDAEGRIQFISTYHAGEDYQDALRKEGRLFIECDDCDLRAEDVVGSRYVADGALKERPAITIDRREVSVGETATITGLPFKASVTIDGVAHDVKIDGGELTFEADHPGDYEIVIDAWPCLPFREVIAVR